MDYNRNYKSDGQSLFFRGNHTFFSQQTPLQPNIMLNETVQTVFARELEKTRCRSFPLADEAGIYWNHAHPQEIVSMGSHVVLLHRPASRQSVSNRSTINAAISSRCTLKMHAICARHCHEYQMKTMNNLEFLPKHGNPIYTTEKVLTTPDCL